MLHYMIVTCILTYEDGGGAGKGSGGAGKIPNISLATLHDLQVCLMLCDMT